MSVKGTRELVIIGKEWMDSLARLKWIDIDRYC